MTANGCARHASEWVCVPAPQAPQSRSSIPLRRQLALQSPSVGRAARSATDAMREPRHVRVCTFQPAAGEKKSGQCAPKLKMTYSRVDIVRHGQGACVRSGKIEHVSAWHVKEMRWATGSRDA